MCDMKALSMSAEATASLQQNVLMALLFICPIREWGIWRFFFLCYRLPHVFAGVHELVQLPYLF
jgi:hypothetical protein